MNEELRVQRCRQYGSFLYCPMRDKLCFGRHTDQECKYDSCILDDPEYQKLQRTIERNRRRRNEERKEQTAFVPPRRSVPRSENQMAWEEVHAIEKQAARLYRKNKPKIADGLMAKAMNMRRMLAQEDKRKE